MGHAGLVETLGLFARHVEDESRLQVVLSLDSSVRSTPERELIVYQIARRASPIPLDIQAAKTVWLSLKSSPDLCEVVVEDDGFGFNPGESRALSLWPATDEGTRLTIDAELQIRSRPE